MPSLPPWSAVQPVLLTVVLPGAAASAGLLAVVCTATRSVTGRLLGGALALAGGLAAGNFFRGLLPWWSLECGWPSLFPATLAAIGGGVTVAVATRRDWRWGLAVRLMTVAGCAWWLTPGGSLALRVSLFVLLFVGIAGNREALHHSDGASLGPKALLAVAILWGAAAATVLLFAHSARFSDLAVLQTASLCGVGVVAALRKLEVTAVLAGPAFFFPALMLGGATNTYSEVPMASFALVALAPCALLALRVPAIRRWPGMSNPVVVVVVLLLPCVMAVILAMCFESVDFGN